MSTPNKSTITFLPNNNIEIELLRLYGDQTLPQFKYVVNSRDILNVWKNAYDNGCNIAIRRESIKPCLREYETKDIWVGHYQDLGEEHQSHPIFFIRHRAYSLLKKFGLGSPIKLEDNHRTLITNAVENTDIGNIMS